MVLLFFQENNIQLKIYSSKELIDEGIDASFIEIHIYKVSFNRFFLRK